jgi:hypothetical protein
VTAEKVGADDFIVATGATADDLDALPRAELEPESDSQYLVSAGRICRRRRTKETTIVEPLCNFTARVVEELVLDDGVETVRTFVLEGALESGASLPPARVTAARFGGMAWVPEHWGLRAIVRAGLSTRDALREAIQVLSPQARSRHVFTHTGWRQVDGEWVYLTAGGAVGHDGAEVDLGPELARYRLPRFAEDPTHAMLASLALLRVAPLTVTVPLWAATFRAPLATALPVDLAIWLEGMTGSLKSTLAALFLAHFGEFTRLTLPGAWASTANALERRAFLLKDTLFVIDDYAPRGTDVRELELKASRLLRAQGNLAGRARLRADLSERPAFPPRGLIIATGEQHPPGQSVLARTLVVDVDRSDIDLTALTAAQQFAHRLPHAMSGYITWLASQMAELKAKLGEAFAGARARAVESNEHLRIPEGLAHLWIGLDCGLNYAVEVGACSPEEAEKIRGEAWEALTSLGRSQGRLVEEERPSRRFLRVLHTLLVQRRGVLLARSDGGEDLQGSELLGWQDNEFLYLIGEAAWHAVSRFCRDAGEVFPVREERLKQDLLKEGLAEPDPGRRTATVKIAGRTRRALRLNRAKVEELVGETFPSPVVTAVTGFAEDR